MCVFFLTIAAGARVVVLSLTYTRWLRVCVVIKQLYVEDTRRLVRRLLDSLDPAIQAQKNALGTGVHFRGLEKDVPSLSDRRVAAREIVGGTTLDRNDSLRPFVNP